MTRFSALLTRLLCSFSVVGMLIVVPSAQAQSHASARVLIPFDFSVNGMHAPAGQYLIKMASFNMMSVVNTTTGTTQFWLVRQEQGRDVQDHGRLVFERDGQGTYLTQIWVAGTSNHSETIGRPKIRREIVAKNGSAPVSTFEIALK